ncbi:hypothetical protein AHAS_Ahas13G0218500 [Arachis hypogaea]
MWIWHLLVLEKYKILIWLCIHDALLTAISRFNRCLSDFNLYPRCLLAPETILHCLKNFPKAIVI